MDRSIPYPRPDYADEDLMSKELANGTFVSALFGDLSHFKPALERYDMNADKLIDRSLSHGKIKPEDYDLSMRDFSLDGLKEMAWQPAKREEEAPTPQKVYDPKRHYRFVEWVGYHSTPIDAPASTRIGYRLKLPYYDAANPGLFGWRILKSDEGEAIERAAAFAAIKEEYRIKILGRVPEGVEIESALWCGWTKGGFLFYLGEGEYLSFTLDGGVYRLSGMSPYFQPLGDDGAIAIETPAGETVIYDVRFETQARFEEGLCKSELLAATNYSRYPLGTKIDGTYYYPKDPQRSSAFRRRSDGTWQAGIVDHPLYKYRKRVLYDYVSDNWISEPLGSLKYNWRKNGCVVRSGLPKIDGAEIRLPGSDIYGDFLRVEKETGEVKILHTFDFKRFEELTGEAATHLYGCWERLWIEDDPLGRAALMPYLMEIKDVDDRQGGRKTVLHFMGFIFWR